MQVKLIVIDSIAFHFRQDFQDMAQRTRVLAEMAQKLMHLAEKRDLAVSSLQFQPQHNPNSYMLPDVSPNGYNASASNLAHRAALLNSAGPHCMTRLFRLVAMQHISAPWC